MKKNKIVLINQASGYLTLDIANAFANSGNYARINLITSWVRVQENELSSEVKLTKTIYHSRKSNLHRIIRWVLASLHIYLLLATRFRRYEVFFISVPPMSYWWGFFMKRKFSILIFDVYPDILSTFGVKASNPIYRFWSWVNKKVFRKAHRLFTLSDGMKEQLKQYTDETEKIHVINNWSGFTKIVRIPHEENEFRKAHVAKEKFLVQYSGNVSASHNTDIMLQLAERLKAHDDQIAFQIIGRGNYFEVLKKKAVDSGLTNIQFLPFQDDSLLYQVFSASDLSLVLVGKDVANISVPSKLYNLQSVGTPILGIAPSGAELEKHLRKYQNGTSFEPGQLDEVSAYILRLASDSKLHQNLVARSMDTAQYFSFTQAENYYKLHVT